MNDNKNMILAIVLSAIVLIGWGLLTETFLPTANEPTTRIEKGEQVAVPRPQADPGADSPAAIRDLDLVLAETPRVRIATPNLRGSVNLRGARIDDLVLLHHTQDLRRNSPPVRLFSPAGTPGAYFGGFGWTGQGVVAPGADTVWQADGQLLAPSRPVTLSWDNGQGQTFRIRLSIDDGYLVTAEQRIENRGRGAVAVRPYALVSRVGASRDPDTWTAHVGPMGVFDGSADYANDYDEVAEAGERRFSGQGGWVGFTDQFWLSAVIPDQSGTVDSAIRYNRGSNSYQSEFVAAPQIVRWLYRLRRPRGGEITSDEELGIPAAAGEGVI